MKSHQLEKNMATERNTSSTGETSQELEFLRKIVATKEHEVDGLKRRLELALSPAALLEMVTPKKKEVPKRMYCDICESFDQHETEECPKQAMDEADGPSKRPEGMKKKPAPREYCDQCEEFDHSTESCPKTQRKKRDYTF